jgi:hypothetical protein
MTNSKPQIKGATIVIILLLAVVGALAYSTLKAPVPTTGDINPADKFSDQVGSAPGQQPTNIITTNSKFGDDNVGQFRPAVYNVMDTTATTYTVNTIRVYQIVDGIENFFGTVATVVTGVAPRGTASNTLDITGYDENNNLYKYVAYVTASDGVRTSGRFEFTAAEDVVKTYAVPNQSTLIFKVYDEENRGYLFTSGEEDGTVVAGTAKATGQTFANMTANTTEAVGQGGYFDYTVYFSQNGTASTATQFEDQVLLMAVDGQDLSDWQTPSISIPGAVVTLLSPGQYNDKIKNDGYDWIYSITNADGTPLHIDSTWTKARIQVYAKSGVNPSDNIGIAMYTGGYYTQTVGDGMKMDTHKDDASQTAVFTAQTLTLSID